MATKKTRVADIKTHDGHILTQQEALFIDKYIETGNISEAYRQAYVYFGKKKDKEGNYVLTAEEKRRLKNCTQNGQTTFVKSYINHEIKYRRDKIFEANMGTSQEVMDFFFKAMRGEIKDQFGLEATLGDRLKAANELAKRTVDIDNRVDGKADQVVEIKVDWKR